MALPAMVRFAALLAAGVATATAAVAGDWQEGVQGALLLSAMLPKHGPPPAPELEAKMEKAGELGYHAYGLLQSASQSVEEAQQQIHATARVRGAASNLAAGEDLLRQGAEALKEGQRLQREAETGLLSGADPLGAPPEAPQDWARVGAMLQRAASKERALRGSVAEFQHSARQAGVSLLDVAERPKPARQDAVAQKQEDKLLAFISGY
mmetsp:Transcript_140182/g.435965  ORF Transcript_140182/g.435965 Transcript_140182/m.435965 type:complete len:209 (-) Transcript_140182:71-697(-)